MPLRNVIIEIRTELRIICHFMPFLEQLNGNLFLLFLLEHMSTARFCFFTRRENASPVGQSSLTMLMVSSVETISNPKV